MKALIFVIALIPSIWISAQTPIIEVLNYDPTMTMEEAALYNIITSNTTYSCHEYIDWNPLSSSLSNSEIHLDLPNDSCGNLVFSVKNVDYSSELDYYWYGELVPDLNNLDCDCFYGSITLLSNQNGKTGHIRIGSDVYELGQYGQGKYLLSCISQSQFSGIECTSGSGGESMNSSGSDQSSITTRSNSFCKARCLALYSPNALLVEGNEDRIENRIELGIRQMNEALKNSDISKSELKVELVGIEEAVGFIEGQDMPNQVRNIVQQGTYGPLISQYDADILIIITDNSYPNLFGFADKIGPIKESAVAIIETGSATATYTLAHEIAHMYGARHDKDPNATFDEGFNFGVGSWVNGTCDHVGTVVNRLNTANRRIPHFSNPDVLYDAEPTGITNDFDNARKLVETGCIVADFRTTIENPAIQISGELYGCHCGNTTISASMIAGTPGVIYSFTWEYADDGVNWTTLGPGNQKTISLPCQSAFFNMVWVKVIANGSDGSSVQDVQWIQLYDQGQTLPNGTTCSGSGNLVSGGVVFPNPSSQDQESYLQLDVSKEGNYTINSIDINGKLIRPIAADLYLQEGQHTISIGHSNNRHTFIQVIQPNGVSKIILQLNN